MTRNQIIILLLCAFLAIGVFLPLITAPLIGSINYFQNGEGDGSWILLCAAAGAIFTFTKFQKLAFIPGLAAMVILMLFYLHYQETFAEFKTTQTDPRVAFSGLAKALKNSVNLGSGFIIMAISATGLAILPAILNTNEQQTSKNKK